MGNDVPVPQHEGQPGKGQPRRARKARRAAGYRWRILAHEAERDGGRTYSVAHHPGFGGLLPDGPHYRNITLSQTYLDEVVIDRWLHVEQLDTGVWWLNVGGVLALVTADRDGRPRKVQVHGPGTWNDREKGCEYMLTWDDKAAGSAGPEPGAVPDGN